MHPCGLVLQVQTPLERADKLSDALGNNLLLKREDLQPVSNSQHTHSVQHSAVGELQSSAVGSRGAAVKGCSSSAPYCLEAVTSLVVPA